MARPGPPASGAVDDVDNLARRLDPDRWLASRFVADRDTRADVVALYAFDAELARVGLVASNPLTGEIRLAWWRDAIKDIFEDSLVQAHPALRALAGAISRRGLPRLPLDRMIGARASVLTGIDASAAEQWADACGASAAVLAARILDPSAAETPVALAGRAWGLLLLRRSSALPKDVIDPLLRKAFAAAAVSLPGLSPAAFPAVAYATLIRADLRSCSASGLERRLRLVAAVARGRI